MQLFVINETGMDVAIRAARASHNSYEASDNLGPKDLALLERLARAGDDHSKCLRLAQIYVEVFAPLYWWVQMDTYRYGVHLPPLDLEDCPDWEGASESTMHSLASTLLQMKTEHRPEMLQSFFTPQTDQDSIMRLYEHTGDIERLKASLPMGFLQRRIGCISYQAARRIWIARHNHGLEEWRVFCDSLLEQVKYPTLLRKAE